MGIYKMRTEFGTHLKIVLGVVAVIFIVGVFWGFGTPVSKRGPETQGPKTLAVV
ncbi:unnamed protein product, partial [marine sediment metagenome]